MKQRTTLSHILTADAYEDAVATVLALGGSTNAVIHLIAMAGRSGVKLTLDDFDRIARTVPVLADLRPGGRYLMEDFHFAGGLPGFRAGSPTSCTWTGPPSRTPPCASSSTGRPSTTAPSSASAPNPWPRKAG
ncbi:Dihydroxy-acid dehydratase [Streptomyces badius]